MLLKNKKQRALKYIKYYHSNVKTMDMQNLIVLVTHRCVKCGEYNLFKTCTKSKDQSSSSFRWYPPN